MIRHPRSPRRWGLTRLAALGSMMLGMVGAAHADIHVGVIVSTTGPSASLGIPAEQAVRMWPTEMAGQKLKVTLLNDNSDTGTAAKHAAKLITEDKVDVIVGSSTTPVTLALLETAAAAQVPVMSLAGGGAIVLPQEGSRRWAFKLAATETITTNMVLAHLKKNKGKTLATVTVANSYGEGFLKNVESLAPGQGVTLVGNERYNMNDQSVTAQVLKIMAANPDGVFILSSGTPGALPHAELVKRGYKGFIYQTQGVANHEFMRVGGKDVEGGFIAMAPVLVAEQLPDQNPTKKPAMDFLRAYEGRYGANSRSLFAATAWDVQLMLQQASQEALKKAKPGTPEFRVALRDSMENIREFAAGEGVFTMSNKDHNGVDARAQVLVRIEKGDWKLVP